MNRLVNLTIQTGLDWLRQQQVEWNVREDQVRIKGHIVKLHYRRHQPSTDQIASKMNRNAHPTQTHCNRVYPIHGGQPEGMGTAEEQVADHKKPLV